MNNDYKEIVMLYSEYLFKNATDISLINWAITQLENGSETESIMKLAGLNKYEFNEAKSLFESSIKQLGYQLPSQKNILLYRAKKIAEHIIIGDIQPNEGCSLIGQISDQLEWPSELGEFSLLAHEQTGHENLGITAENIRPEIFKAAKNLHKLEI